MGSIVKNLTYRHTIQTCYVAYVVQAIINNLGPLLFLTYEKSLGISLEKIGLLITLNFGTQILVDMLAAKYVDRFGYRASIRFAHIAATIGLVGMGVFPFLFGDAFLGLAVAAVINSIGGGIIEVLVSPIVEAAPSGEKDKAMSLLHSFYCFGHMGVVILSTIGFALFGMGRWYLLPILWAIVPFVNIFLFSFVPINAVVAAEHTMPARKLFKMKLFWIFVLLMICAGASEQAISQWVSFFAEDGLKVSKTVGDLMGPCAFALMMAISRVFYGRQGHKVDLHRFIIYSCAACIAGYAIAVLAPHPALALAGCALCGLSVGIMWPGTFSIAAEECPQGGTVLWAMLALAGDVGCAAGPGTVSWVSAALPAWGLKAGLAAAVLFPVVMLVVSLERMRHTKALKQSRVA